MYCTMDLIIIVNCLTAFLLETKNKVTHYKTGVSCVFYENPLHTNETRWYVCDSGCLFNNYQWYITWCLMTISSLSLADTEWWNQCAPARDSCWGSHKELQWSSWWVVVNCTLPSTQYICLGGGGGGRKREERSYSCWSSYILAVHCLVGSIHCNTISLIAGINVPRRRFLPVKKTSDLLVVMSNLFKLKSGTLMMNPERTFPTMPLVKLGDPDFTKVWRVIGKKVVVVVAVSYTHLRAHETLR